MVDYYLRICSQAENMNNPLTKRKLSRIVLDSDGNEFESITECAKFYGVTVAAIWARLNGKRPSKGFKYKTSLSNHNDYPSERE